MVEVVDIDLAPDLDPFILKARRWVSLADGRVASTDPFMPFTAKDGVLAGHSACLLSGRETDKVLSTTLTGKDEDLDQRYLGRLLLAGGIVTEEEFAEALDEDKHTERSSASSPSLEAQWTGLTRRRSAVSLGSGWRFRSSWRCSFPCSCPFCCTSCSTSAASTFCHASTPS